MTTSERLRKCWEDWMDHSDSCLDGESFRLGADELDLLTKQMTAMQAGHQKREAELEQEKYALAKRVAALEDQLAKVITLYSPEKD